MQIRFYCVGSLVERPRGSEPIYPRVARKIGLYKFQVTHSAAYNSCTSPKQHMLQNLDHSSRMQWPYNDEC